MEKFPHLNDSNEICLFIDQGEDGLGRLEICLSYMMTAKVTKSQSSRLPGRLPFDALKLLRNLNSLHVIFYNFAQPRTEIYCLCVALKRKAGKIVAERRKSFVSFFSLLLGNENNNNP